MRCKYYYGQNINNNNKMPGFLLTITHGWTYGRDLSRLLILLNFYPMKNDSFWRTAIEKSSGETSYPWIFSS